MEIFLYPVLLKFYFDQNQKKFNVISYLLLLDVLAYIF